jgi:hypothetical protein
VNGHQHPHQHQHQHQLTSVSAHQQTAGAATTFLSNAGLTAFSPPGGGTAATHVTAAGQSPTLNLSQHAHAVIGGGKASPSKLASSSIQECDNKVF